MKLLSEQKFHNKFQILATARNLGSYIPITIKQTTINNDISQSQLQNIDYSTTNDQNLQFTYYPQQQHKKLQRNNKLQPYEELIQYLNQFPVALNCQNNVYICDGQQLQQFSEQNKQQLSYLQPVITQEIEEMNSSLNKQMCDEIKQQLQNDNIDSQEQKAKFLNSVSTFGLQRSINQNQDQFLQLLQTTDLQQLQPNHNNQTFYLRAYSQLLQILFSNVFYQQQINIQGMQQTEYQYKHKLNEIISRRYALLQWGNFYISSKINKQSLEYKVAINLLLKNKEKAAQFLSDAKQQRLAFKILSGTQFNEQNINERIYKSAIEGKITEVTNHFKSLSQIEILFICIAQNNRVNQALQEFDNICQQQKDIMFQPFYNAIKFYGQQYFIKQQNINTLLTYNQTCNFLVNRFFQELFTSEQTKQIYLQAICLNPFLLNCLPNIDLLQQEQQMILRIALKTGQIFGQQQTLVDVYRGIKKEVKELEKEDIEEQFNCLNYIE